MKPKKLIRKKIISKLKENEWEIITDQDELNRLYEKKIREVLAEIQASGHKDVMEFVDLIQVAFSFAKVNGFTEELLSDLSVYKLMQLGDFSKIVLNNLNPDNPSNKIYFDEHLCFEGYGILRKLITFGILPEGTVSFVLKLLFGKIQEPVKRFN